MRKALYILGQLNDADVQWLQRHGTRRSLGDGEVIVRAGQPVDAVFISLDGALCVTLGNGTRLAQLGAGEFVGEMSFVDTAPPSATVAALGRASVLEIKRTDLQHRIDEDPGFSSRFYRALAIFLADRLRAANHRLGQGEEGDLRGDAVIEDELDDTVLDTVSQAGERFHRLLAALSGG
ncbi:cyclic nucleotide-binding domain-containing protein [Labrys wisconsinensis]|uniref:CRP-like cAMP-binding protein n=1 Tax=Labrys wisconsinensis TaxID=425677 RepID=A0ABU0JDK9_9HYPH|nr:cyclic nucleotide-binding domain-containing protein [Labrys wisconsinensis]MDQ0471601.1 CRP-like cAMP-binding protein [Labrys wisconsinensis]